jgi:hypothetical protein
VCLQHDDFRHVPAAPQPGFDLVAVAPGEILRPPKGVTRPLIYHSRQTNERQGRMHRGDGQRDNATFDSSQITGEMYEVITLHTVVEGNEESSHRHAYFFALSRARLSSNTLTRGSPRNPRSRPDVYFFSRARTAAWLIPLALATRGTCRSA